MKNNSGVTYLEIVIVLAFLAIVSLLAFPNLRAFQIQSSEAKAANDVMMALRQARSSAINYNVEYNVSFDLDGKKFWLERGDRAQKSTIWVKEKEFEAFSQELEMATGSSCDKVAISHGDGSMSADNKIQFNPNGTCGSSGRANSRYICLKLRGKTVYRCGMASSVTGRPVIDNGL